MMFHGEIVLRDGEAVGEVRAASYGIRSAARSAWHISMATR